MGQIELQNEKGDQSDAEEDSSRAFVEEQPIGKVSPIDQPIDKKRSSKQSVRKFSDAFVNQFSELLKSVSPQKEEENDSKGSDRTFTDSGGDMESPDAS